MKPGSCVACLHPNRRQIDDAIVSGRPLRRIAGQFGTSRSSLLRHKAHISEALVQAQHNSQNQQAVGLLDRLEQLIFDANAIAAKASRSREWTPAVSALREVRSCIELLGRFKGELQQQAAVNVAVVNNVSVSQEMNDEERKQVALMDIRTLSADMGEVRDGNRRTLIRFAARGIVGNNFTSEEFERAVCELNAEVDVVRRYEERWQRLAETGAPPKLKPFFMSQGNIININSTDTEVANQPCEHSPL